MTGSHPARQQTMRDSQPAAPARTLGGKLLVAAVSAVTAAVVAAATVGIVHILSPGQPATPAFQGGSFRDHPVVITLPASPDSYVGAFVRGVPASYAPIQSFATTTGIAPNIALYYSGWGEPFQTAFARQAMAHHAVLLVQMEPGRTSLAAIAGGVYDGFLEAYANAVARFGAQTGQAVIIGFGHEPNGSWYPWGYRHVDPAVWVAAWRHVVNVFRWQGADNVTWLWTVNIIDSHGRAPIPAPDPWWPGSRYVTWVGIDGYYYKPTWTFASLFGPTIRAVRGLTRDPVLISETGAAPVAGKSAKITDLFAGIRAYGLLGLVWFNADRVRDWRINTTAAAAAFRREARSFHRPGT